MKLLAALSGLSLLIACSTDDTPYQSCDDLAKSAQADLQTAITKGASCIVDADCISVSFAADCFDSCSRAAAAAGKAAIDTERDNLNQSTCQSFVSQGCKLTVPPCAPPSTPRCAQGVCQ